MFGLWLLSEKPDEISLRVLLPSGAILLPCHGKTNCNVVVFVKKAILRKFPGKDTGESRYFLQQTITRNRADRTIYLKQQRHIDSLIDQYGLRDAWPVSIPMITGVYKDPEGTSIKDAAVISQYKSIVGALLHISNNTRPDIAFAVSYLARFTAAPTSGNFAATTLQFVAP